MIAYFAPMADHVGLFIPLPPGLARQYPAEGKAGEDTSPPHMTLVYIGALEDHRLDELRGTVAKMIQAIPPLELRLLPPSTFENKKGQTIISSPVAGPWLRRAHDALDGALRRRGFDVQGYDQFRPHVTIEYVDPGARPRFAHLCPRGRWVARSLGVWAGDDRRSYRFGPPRTVEAKRRVIEGLLRGARGDLAQAVATAGLAATPAPRW